MVRAWVWAGFMIGLAACGDDAPAWGLPIFPDGGLKDGDAAMGDMDSATDDSCADMGSIVHTQAELDALIRCGPLPLYIQIDGDVESLAGLSGITHLGQLRVYNSSLSPLAGLESVVFIDAELSLQRTQVEETDLPNLQTVRTLAVDDSPKLRFIRMHGLETTAWIGIASDDALEECLVPQPESQAGGCAVAS